MTVVLTRQLSLTQSLTETSIAISLFARRALLDCALDQVVAQPSVPRCNTSSGIACP